ncbi:MAG: multicopper oxidase domain-containing protein [Thermoplasmatota archaeon]
MSVAAVLAAMSIAGCVGFDDMYQPQVREITMWVEQMDWEIHPGVTTTVWAFCAEGDGVEPVHEGNCGVPGPTIHATTGDTIRLTFKNTHMIPHSVHFHGWHPFVADMNGNSLLDGAMVTAAQSEQVVEWVAEPTGSYIYHCHVDTPMHMEMGMYGAYIVHDPDEEPVQDEVLVVDEWSLHDQPTFHGAMPVYNYFTMNGKSFPLTAPIVAEPGTDVRIHMVNAGYEFHAMHIHGYTPDSYEGVAGPEHAVPTDVRELAPGQTVVLDFNADKEGVWLFHDHVVPSVTAGANGQGFGAYPRGMLTVLVVGEEYLEKLTEIVPELLGHAQGDAAGERSHAEHGHDDHSHEPTESPQTNTGGVQMDIKDFAFGEAELRVPAGTTVTWTNRDGAVHTVTSEDALFDSGNMQGGDTFSHTFDAVGEFGYYCIPHAYKDGDEWKGMVATVVVE